MVLHTRAYTYTRAHAPHPFFTICFIAFDSSFLSSLAISPGTK